ncbi:MAG: DUF2079 domain-containing protein [Chthoniobacter sp.]|uniref:DUF2079 domain-containing protein n=1 Tax=Chthoniobacter sp. TaxID=2510640 RepID=UPI0032AD7382
MSLENSTVRRVLIWVALLFSAVTFTVSWWHWWTFQYGTFDLAFYVQALWLALRGKWMVSLLNVPLMGNHAEPIVFLLLPLFAICPHPMLFVAVQTLAFATMPFTAWRIGQLLKLEPKAALLLALATVVSPVTFSIGIYEFHPEALAAPLLLLLLEARLAERYGRFWLWFVAVLAVKENMAPLLFMYGAVFTVLEWKRGRQWQMAWNFLPMGLAVGWLLIFGKVISPALNAGNVDYLQLYGHLGNSPGDIIHKFFTQPHLVLGALRTALYAHPSSPSAQGDMLPALLLPLLLLPLLRPRWLLISAPLLLQHLLSYRYSEWTLGAHYPAPFLALFWVAAAEALTRLRAQTAIAAAVLVACALAHFRFGPAREIAREIPGLSAVLEEREWKAQMIADIPDDASVTAGLGFLPHLAKREKLVSLHHILKGLKTLSVVAYVPPPTADVVVIDYGDTLTFNTVAGYYHPWSHIDAEHSVPSSDRLLNDYLIQAHWRTQSRNAVAVLRRGEPIPPPVSQHAPTRIDDQTTLADLQVTRKLPGAWQIQMTWNFIGERRRFPWLMLVLSDGKRLFPIVKGICAPEAGEGRYTEEWNVVFPTWMHPGYHAVFAEFYDNNEAAWSKKMPPGDQTHMLTLIDLGATIIKPGDFTAPAAEK